MLAYEVYQYWLSQRFGAAPPKRIALQNIERGGQLPIAFMLYDKDAWSELAPPRNL